MLNYQKSIKPDEQALITNLFARRLAHPLALAAYACGLGANAVTILGGLCWILSTPVVVIAGFLSASHNTPAGMLCWFLAGCLWNLGYVLDIADGSLARMTGSASRRGFFLDYVFHLLFKPAFLASIGIALALMHGNSLPLLLLAILSIPANWSASSSAAEHVLCEETGKQHLPPLPAPADPAHESRPSGKSLWLGLSDISEPVSMKKRSLVSAVRTILTEILSYYGQFTFFSLTVLADLVLSFLKLPVPRFPCTTLSFILLTLFFLFRVPFRVARDYRRFGSL
ncbi:MAG: CDP-alcohol phosphatidyltransferase family protein [Kiritimatiellia bacterium]